jgi:hypothetical protein
MNDFFLKFTEKSQAAEVLNDYKGSVDFIGVIYARTGGTEEEPIMSEIPGWHVNLRGVENEEIKKYLVEVKTPFRLWLDL